MTGYSGTPLAAKLGIKPGMVMRAVHAPKEYRELLTPLPEGARVASGGRADIVHHFTREKSELRRALRGYRDVSEDVIRALALPLGYVDIKVCAVSDVWSGLKFVVRLEHR